VRAEVGQGPRLGLRDQSLLVPDQPRQQQADAGHGGAGQRRQRPYPLDRRPAAAQRQAGRGR
jgi:hypothetical protein